MFFKLKSVKANRVRNTVENQTGRELVYIVDNADVADGKSVPFCKTSFYPNPKFFVVTNKIF